MATILCRVMFLTLCVQVGLYCGGATAAARQDAVAIDAVAADIDFETQISPIFTRYCTSCHNEDDVEGGLDLSTFIGAQEGGESGPAFLVGEGADSHIVRRIQDPAELRMPPDDMEGPNAEETALLIAWIDQGAAGPSGMAPDRTRLIVPNLPASDQSAPITSMAWSLDGQRIAVARFGQVEIVDPETGGTVGFPFELPGKVNSLEFSSDGRWLVCATGVTGLYGLAVIWDVESGEEIARFQAHRDSLYAATIDQQKKHLATAGYDKTIRLWDIETQEVVHELTGHNQPVFGLAFNQEGTVLASAGADEAVKVWHVAQGTRLDTLGQPLAEQYVTAFSPDGRWIVGAGADSRIRVWEFVSREQPRINPLVLSRFAHEGPITAVAFSLDGSRLVSVSEDRSIKTWDTSTWTEQQLFSDQPEIVSAIALSPDGRKLFVGRMDGSLELLELNAESANTVASDQRDVEAFTRESTDMIEATESEPNNSIAQATHVVLPAISSGAMLSSNGEFQSDVDFYGFDALAGEQWTIEIVASRDGSPMDSRIEVLDENSQPIERVLLQAVRDSYFTFRGKNSSTSDDFRVHNWEEMTVNEFLYANGEVVKLWHYPRGPDSGFQVYPGKGNRHAFFDTTPLAHALQSPCYIVVPHPPGTELIPNGLPTFPIYYENDDESTRQAGTDSKLTFTAPRDGRFFVRVTDTRGFTGEAYTYRLQIRPPRPDFHVTLGNTDPTVTPGGGKEFVLTAKRIDGYDGPITIDIEGLPPGFHASTPITIEAGQYEATGVIWADSNAPAPTAENESNTHVVARAQIGDAVVEHDVNSLGKIQLGEAAQVLVMLTDTQQSDSTSIAGSAPIELTIRPGETITASVSVERNGFAGRVAFGNADSGRNLPHGVYVDNIGLNGLMIVEGQNERTFFITADSWVRPQERLFHLQAQVQGNQASIPVLLRVVE